MEGVRVAQKGCQRLTVREVSGKNFLGSEAEHPGRVRGVTRSQ